MHAPSAKDRQLFEGCILPMSEVILYLTDLLAHSSINIHTQAPSAKDRELFEGCIRSWYVVGKLGGYNSQNLQMHYAADEDRSYFDYDAEAASDSMGSFMHGMSEVDYREAWARIK